MMRISQIVAAFADDTTVHTLDENIETSTNKMHSLMTNRVKLNQINRYKFNFQENRSYCCLSK